MSDVVVNVVESATNVTVTEQDVAVDVTETVVEVSASTAGIQGASYNQGDPIYVTVRNATGATLPKGTIVYTAGAQGNHTLVQPALATGDATSARTLGWVSANIANNADGFVMVEGYLDGIDTDHIAEGAQLYLSGTVAGSFTATKPQAPIHLVYVGVVTKSNPGNGRVLVKVQNGYELDEIHDVKITTPANNDVLTYDAATDLWINKVNAADGVTSITATAPLTGGTITSTGSIGLDQTALNITQSQVTNLVTDLAGKANLAGGNAITGAQTITSTAIGEFPLSIIPASGQTASTFRVRNAANNADLMSIDSSGQIRTTTILNPNSFNNSRLQMQNTGVFIDTGITTNVPLAVRGASGQTADLLVIQNSTPSNLFAISSAGLITAKVVGNAANQSRGLLLSNTADTWQSGLYLRSDGSGFPRLSLLAPTGALGEAVSIDSAAKVGIGNVTPVAQLDVYSQSASRVGQVVRGAVSQTADLFKIQNSAGTDLSYFAASGDMWVTGAVRSLFYTNKNNTGGYLNYSTNSPMFEQRIATEVGLRVRGAASQVEDLTEWQNSNGTVLGGRNANAQIFSGSTTPITTAVGAGINGVSGNGTLVTFSTTNAHNLADGDRVTIAGLTPAGYNGTYIISGVSTFSFNIANTTTGTASGSGTVSVDSQASVTVRSAGTTGTIIRGASGQASNLLEVQNNGAVNLAVISSTGTFRSAGLITAGSSTDVLGQLSVITTAASRVGAVIRSAGSQTADTLQIQTSGGVVQTYFDAFGNGHIAQAPTGSSFGLYVGTNANPAVGGIMVRGAASQSGDLQQWQNSAGSIIAKVDSVGDITARVQRSTFAARFTTTDPSIAVQVNTGAASQTGDFFQTQTSTGTVMQRLLADGGFSVAQGNMTVNNVGSIFANTINTNVGRIGLGEANSGGQITVTRQTAAATNPGANIARLYFRDGTTAGTLKLVVRAGAAGAETTILDNIPQ